MSDLTTNPHSDLAPYTYARIERVGCWPNGSEVQLSAAAILSPVSAGRARQDARIAQNALGTIDRLRGEGK